MSEKPEITTAFIQEISTLLAKDNVKELQTLLSEFHSADIAELLEELSLVDASKLYTLIDEEYQRFFPIARLRRYNSVHQNMMSLMHHLEPQM